MSKNSITTILGLYFFKLKPFITSISWPSTSIETKSIDLFLYSEFSIMEFKVLDLIFLILLNFSLSLFSKVLILLIGDFSW